MPRMQVYLPNDLYKVLKARRLGASELLQAAVRAEMRRQALLEETDKYLADLSVDVGKPSARQQAKARAVVEQVKRRVRKAG